MAIMVLNLIQGFRKEIHFYTQVLIVLIVDCVNHLSQDNIKYIFCRGVAVIIG